MKTKLNFVVAAPALNRANILQKRNSQYQRLIIYTAFVLILPTISFRCTPDDPVPPIKSNIPVKITPRLPILKICGRDAFPDLIITKAEVTVEDEIVITVANIGSCNANSCRLKIYLQDDAPPYPFTMEEYITVPVLNSGKSVDVKWPDYYPVVYYGPIYTDFYNGMIKQITLTVDDSNLIKEENEANNTFILKPE